MAGKVSQMWKLTQHVVPGDSQPTVITSVVTLHNCLEITACSTAEGAAVGVNFGCKKLPPPGSNPNACALNGAWAFNKNGTITSVMDGHCLQVDGNKLTVGTCAGKPNQIFSTVDNGDNANVIRQGKLCIDYDAASSLLSPPTASAGVVTPSPPSAEEHRPALAAGKPPAPKVYNRSRTVWIPPGEWSNAFTNEVVTGPTTLNLTGVSMDTMPLYHRHGGILVTAKNPSRNAATTDFTNLVLQCWPHSTEYHHRRQGQPIVNTRTFYDRSARSSSGRSGSSGSRGRSGSSSGFASDDDSHSDAIWKHALEFGESTMLREEDAEAHNATSPISCPNDKSPRRITVRVGKPTLHIPHGGVSVASQFAAAPAARVWLARVHLQPEDDVVSATVSRSGFQKVQVGIEEEVPFTVHRKAAPEAQPPIDAATVAQPHNVLSGFVAGPSALGAVVEVEMVAEFGQPHDLELSVVLC